MFITLIYSKSHNYNYASRYPIFCLSENCTARFIEQHSHKSTHNVVSHERIIPEFSSAVSYHRTKGDLRRI